MHLWLRLHINMNWIWCNHYLQCHSVNFSTTDFTVPHLWYTSQCHNKLCVCVTWIVTAVFKSSGKKPTHFINDFTVKMEKRTMIIQWSSWNNWTKTMKSFTTMLYFHNLISHLMYTGIKIHINMNIVSHHVMTLYFLDQLFWIFLLC